MKRIAFSMLLLSMAVGACGGPLKYMPKSAKAPDADAVVIADVKEADHNTRLTIKVEHLAPPSRISESAKHYVVWQRKDSGAQWSRVASLTYSEGDRTGKIVEATVPETAFDLQITAEEKPDVAAPSANLVIEQRVAK